MKLHLCHAIFYICTCCYTMFDFFASSIPSFSVMLCALFIIIWPRAGYHSITDAAGDLRRVLSIYLALYYCLAKPFGFKVYNGVGSNLVPGGKNCAELYYNIYHAILRTRIFSRIAYGVLCIYAHSTYYSIRVYGLFSPLRRFSRERTEAICGR